MNKKELRNMKLLEATDELIKLAKEDVPVRKKMLSNPEFEYHGTVYPSLKVCCEKLGINKSSVISRSHRTGCSLQEAVEYYVSQQERRTLD